jgi:mannose-1-phosphate guanylyltransferase
VISVKAVLLAGGYGKRLRPFTDTVPKPLLEVADKPIIVWQIEWLKAHGIREFVVCAGYLREMIVQTLGSGGKFGVKIGYSVEDEPLGTGGALKNAEHLLKSDSKFIVVNGDVLTTLNPLKMTDLLDRYVACIALTRLPSPYGIVEFDSASYRVRKVRGEAAATQLHQRRRLCIHVGDVQASARKRGLGEAHISELG